MWLFSWYLIKLWCSCGIGTFIGISSSGRHLFLHTVSLCAALILIVPSCIKLCGLLINCRKVHKHQKGKAKMAMNHRGLQNFLWCTDSCVHFITLNERKKMTLLISYAENSLNCGYFTTGISHMSKFKCIKYMLSA